MPLLTCLLQGMEIIFNVALALLKVSVLIEILEVYAPYIFVWLPSLSLFFDLQFL